MTRLLSLGEPAPWFHAPALEGNPNYAFNTAGGRWIVLLAMGSARHPETSAALDLVARHRDLFNDQHACFFGITVDPDDAAKGRISQQLPGIRWFLDYDRSVSKQLRAIQPDNEASYTPHWLLLDPMLRVHQAAGLSEGETIMATLAARLGAVQPEITAPVLVVPDLLPPDLCRRLIDLYEANGGRESGFMREVDGITVEKHDHAHKRRADYMIDDGRLIDGLKTRLATALSPMIKRAFQFEVTRIERFLVACYEGEKGGHFRAHRDNTTRGTAHRKFACTINLNSGEYDGGDLCFPEFGQRTYRAPTGGAVVFSCSLLHEARPVTRGRRYAFLPFLYDEEGAKLRERNLDFVAPHLKHYRSGLEPETEAAGSA